EFTEEEARWMGPDQGTPMHGAGCDHCGSQGLSGRTVISELFLVTEAIGAAIRTGADGRTLRRMADECGQTDMAADGRAKVRAGITTVSEVQRVCSSHRMEES
ncbi:MAG: general secretion pathway protein E, partial [Planctomycetota bacterium]